MRWYSNFKMWYGYELLVTIQVTTASDMSSLKTLLYMVAGLLTVQMLLFRARIHFFPFGIHCDFTEWVRVLCLQKSCHFKTLHLS